MSNFAAHFVSHGTPFKAYAQATRWHSRHTQAAFTPRPVAHRSAGDIPLPIKKTKRKKQTYNGKQQRLRGYTKGRKP